MRPVLMNVIDQRSGLAAEALPELIELQRLRRTEPDHVVGVILERVAGLRVGEHGQALAVEHQPGDDVTVWMLAGRMKALSLI